jgi:hypothetical protein
MSTPYIESGSLTVGMLRELLKTLPDDAPVISLLDGPRILEARAISSDGKTHLATSGLCFRAPYFTLDVDVKRTSTANAWARTMSDISDSTIYNAPR